MSSPRADPTPCFDAVIIGAGVIGCALARRFVLEGWSVAILEKAADVLDGASKGNSAILHTGFDAPVGSVEQRCIAAGYAEYHQIHAALGLPLDRAGALVIAWTKEQAAVLPELMTQAMANCVTDIEPLTAAQTLALEPMLAPDLVASFRVPGESLIDPWSAPHAYVLQAVVNGATLLRGCAVISGDFDGRVWNLHTSQGPIQGRVVVNAAGLWGDQIDIALLGQSDYTIKPRKGQFVVYDKPAAALCRHILLPVPSKHTKGVVVCRTVFGNLLVGPTAEEQDDRDQATVDPETLGKLAKQGARILPALARADVTSSYAGLRPATEFKDYCIKAHAGQNYVTVGGIRSTGLSSALGTASYVFDLCAGILDRDPLANPIVPHVPNLAENRPRNWQDIGNGGIICHCERVTHNDVAAALSGPIAAKNLGGLKRRTRVTMGRCQGNYCAAELARLTRDKLAQPMIGGDDE